MHILRVYRISVITKLTEPVFMKFCEMNYVKRLWKSFKIGQ